MNWKHLLYIIPLVLIIGGLFGFKIFEWTSTQLSDMLKDIDECSIQTLSYVAEKNSDCQILISGYLRSCIDNSSIPPSTKVTGYP